MMKRIFSFLIILSLVFLGACNQNTSTSKSEPDFPTKPIKIIVPFTAGGVSDTVARALAESAQKYLPNNQTVLIENKPGGAGVIGVTEVLNAKPDGYTLGFTVASAVTLLPHQGVTNYTDSDVQMIMRAINNPFVLAVRADAPWDTFEEWFAYLEQNPEKFTYAVASAGGQAQLSMEAFNALAGVKTKSVPFDGGSEQIPALLGGHVDGAVLQGSEVVPYLESNEMKVLINFGSEKPASLEDVPLISEKGFDLKMDLASGLFGPKGIPEEELKIIHDAFKKALEDPETIEVLKKASLEPSYAGLEDFQKEIAETSSVLKKILSNAESVQN